MSSKSVQFFVVNVIVNKIVIEIDTFCFSYNRCIRHSTPVRMWIHHRFFFSYRVYCCRVFGRSGWPVLGEMWTKSNVHQEWSVFHLSTHILCVWLWYFLEDFRCSLHIHLFYILIKLNCTHRRQLSRLPIFSVDTLLGHTHSFNYFDYDDPCHAFSIIYKIKEDSNLTGINFCYSWKIRRILEINAYVRETKALKSMYIRGKKVVALN